jgi:hypothetical protein
MMKVKFLFVGLLAASVGASAAIAAPPPGKGKPVVGPGCKPQVTVVLRGTVASASASTLTVNVTRGNRWARAYVTAGSASVTVDTKTKVRRNGNKTLAAELVPGDWVLVQARTCKADLAANATPALTAVRVVAHPAHT